MKVYYSVPKSVVKKVLICGLNIEEYADGEVLIGEKSYKCIFASLTPYDARRGEGMVLLSIEVDPMLSYVAEGAFRGDASLGGEASDVEKAELLIRAGKFYEESRVLMTDYVFGKYAKPECPLMLSLLPEALSLYNEKQGEPVVYTDSESLYAENVFNDFCDQYGDIRLYSIRCCCELLCKNGQMQKLRVGKNLVFIEKKTKKKIVIPGR